MMKLLLQTARAAGVLIALTTAAPADEPLKIATSGEFDAGAYQRAAFLGRLLEASRGPGFF